ncbi:hypothetical protein DXX93_15690 [Thalassotalea euphylliae]|uniref:YgjV family protein n=1 Tax=Thalassotalea euphylliae TaxID=1655234 RepID=A0A3E0TTX6_9GAMM|nr:hypothetical protein [Thalassotalea euphylliae]REL27853.1 hypothetical protein DXX93_15690 [Thalassotalea euphylliae]
MNPLFFDALSWIGLALCIGAFFIKDILMLRLATLVGCVLMGVYYTHIDVAQGMVSNVVIVAINAFYLLKRNERNNKVAPPLECSSS